MVCIILLILAAVLGANFWVGIIRNTFNDRSSAVGVPQHDFFQYYAGGHNWNLGVDPYVNHPSDAQGDPPAAAQLPADLRLHLSADAAAAVRRAREDWATTTARTVWLALDVSAFALMASWRSL